MVTVFQRSGIFFILFFTITCSVKTSNSVSHKSALMDTPVFVGCQEKIKLEAGSTFEVKLAVIKGTGYQWLLKNQPVILEQIEPDILKYSASEGREGMPGEENF